MKLIVEPDNGVAPVLTAIRRAKKSLDVVIFRLDIPDIIHALGEAVARGVSVRTLVAHTNKGGEKRLRKLELAFLGAGVTVSRTADNLVRYHGKMMIVDDKILHLYGFNFTRLDFKRSRSFGIVTRHPKLVAEAKKLFEADCARHPYSPGCDRFIVSPENSRARLAAFLKRARKRLLIYDLKVSDHEMVNILVQRARAGVDVRVIGKVGGKLGRSMPPFLVVEPYPGKHLHVRAIVRDDSSAFIGSQSLRRLELEQRRELGMIVKHRGIVAEISRIFEQDWTQTPTGRRKPDQDQQRTEEAPPTPGASSATA